MGRLMRLIGRAELIDNPRFAARVKHEALDAIITEWTRQHTKEEAMALISGVGGAGRCGLGDSEALRAIHVRGYHFRSARSGVPSPN